MRPLSAVIVTSSTFGIHQLSVKNRMSDQDLYTLTFIHPLINILGHIKETKISITNRHLPQFNRDGNEEARLC